MSKEKLFEEVMNKSHLTETKNIEDAVSLLVNKTGNNDKNVEQTMDQLEASIKALSDSIYVLCESATPNEDAALRKQKLINTFKTTATTINRMQNISDSVDTLEKSRIRLIKLLGTNGLLSEEEVNSLL